MITSKMYYNPSYQGCNNIPCYLIYMNDGQLYAINPVETFKVYDKPTFELTLDNIDSYAEARGFIKVLEKDEYGIITYFNSFESPEKREELAKFVREFKQSVYINMRYSPTQTKAMFNAYSEANSLETKIW